jgi:hypothetical protein
MTEYGLRADRITTLDTSNPRPPNFTNQRVFGTNGYAHPTTNELFLDINISSLIDEGTGQKVYNLISGYRSEYQTMTRWQTKGTFANNSTVWFLHNNQEGYELGGPGQGYRLVSGRVGVTQTVDYLDYYDGLSIVANGEEFL